MRPGVARGVGTAVLLGIAAYDIAVGLWMLLADTPAAAHGPGTLWDDLPLDAATESLLRRLGAFSLHAGLVTAAAAALTHRRPQLRSAMWALWAAGGIGFGWTDATFFANTPYHAVKTAIGAAFAVGVLLHVGRGRQADGVDRP